MKVRATIEKGSDGLYCVTSDDHIGQYYFGGFGLTEEEAIEDFKQSILESFEADLEIEFPEHREDKSNDEKTREWLIDYFKSASKTWIHREISPKQILAYLEKQKINTEGDFGSGYDCGYEACLNSHGAEWFEKQKERKPAEWGDGDEERLINTSISFLNDFADKGYENAVECIDWLKSLRPSWKPSEEQMNALYYGINDLRFCSIGKERIPILEEFYEQLKKLK